MKRREVLIAWTLKNPPLALLAKGQGKWVVTYQREVAE